MSSVSVIIVAAGSGTRMGADKNKQFLNIRGVPVIARTLRVFENMPEVEKILVVTRAGDIDEMRRVIECHGIKKVFDVIKGGDTRQQSVMNGLEHLGGEDDDIVLIHDGARPFIRAEFVRELISQIESENCEAAAIGVPVKDTIKQIDDHGFISSTPDRDSLISVQTPQGFRYGLIMKAHTRAKNKSADFTDDCAVAESFTTERVMIIKGDYRNIKITTPEDLALAEIILENEQSGGIN